MKPVYIFDQRLATVSDRIPNLKGRAEMVHSLIAATGLLPLLELRESSPCGTEELLTFHSQGYLDQLTRDREEEEDETVGPLSQETEEYGLGYDCPIFNDMLEFAQVMVGGTLTAVNAVKGGARIAINWCGGWHHAQRDQASGFCYVNDIVIGIQSLLQQFKKVLYVDLDSHHGDGVENAFSYSNRVMTLSIHHHEVGYFPGTGGIKDVGFGKGKFHTVNVPLKGGASDDDFIFVFERVFASVLEYFEAEVVVVQCGADCLSGDPLGNFSLTEKSLVHSSKTILSRGLPCIFLGGGGYKLTNAAIAWTTLTAAILNTNVPDDIPEHKYFMEYGPDFTFGVSQGLKTNENTTEHLRIIISQVEENLKKISGS